MKAGDLVRTVTGNLAMIASIDETISDELGEHQAIFVTLIYCNTGIMNCYCDTQHLRLIQRCNDEKD